MFVLCDSVEVTNAKQTRNETMSNATTNLINMVCNFGTMHVALAEGFFTERFLYTTEQFDAALDAAVESGLIAEANNVLNVVR
jgi:hypothetical protein